MFRITIGLIKAKKLGSVSQNASGVRAGRRQFDRAFLATMPNGHQGVFRRLASQWLIKASSSVPLSSAGSSSTKSIRIAGSLISSRLLGKAPQC
jgi:hypothetical protein